MIFVALLHAVNLGARRKVPMADLRALLTGLGLEGVRTYIQSGNAVFSADPETDLRGRLEAALEAQFGFPALVTLRTAHAWREAARGCPAHLRDEAVVGQTLYQTVPDGVRTLNLSSGVLERTLGVKVTVRNERTVQAIAAMLDT